MDVAGRELHLLRRVDAMVPAPDRVQHDPRLLLRSSNGPRAGRRASADLLADLPRGKPRPALLLQVQLLAELPHRSAARKRGTRIPARGTLLGGHRRCGRLALQGRARRHLLLHVPNAQLHDRHLLPQALAYGQFPRLRVVVAFFPQLVAGPIVRAVEFLPQLDLKPRFDRIRLHNGLYRIGIGLAKKAIIADSLGTYLVDPCYADPSNYGVFIHVLAIYGFAFQIYYDFSGYSDIAIGAARLLGFDLPENFVGPYQSLSIREFWRRWHITLSSWVRDYMFFPLGGSRGRELIVIRNLLITMVTIGLWHGASFLWLTYGLLQGIAMSIERFFERLRGGQESPRPAGASSSRGF